MKDSSVKWSILCSLAAAFAIGCGGNTNEKANQGVTAATDAGPKSACDSLHTQFAGDDKCIPAPDPEVGMQLHVGPTDYDNPDEAWIVEPGHETVECYHMKTPNTEDRLYFAQQYRMRPGSHHMILQTSTATDQPEGWAPCGSSIISAIGGTQHTVEDYPPGLKIADEDKGLGKSVAAQQPLDIQLHFFNATDKPTLREVWVNFIYKDPSEVTAHVGMMGAFAPVNVLPHTTAVTGGTCNASDAIGSPTPDGVRIVSLFGHAHWHNQRFVVYRDKAGSTTEDVVYDSYDGAEAPSYSFNSLVTNPVPNPASRLSGAVSGDLVLAPTDKLRFECDITNDLNTTLTSTNEAFTGEMCILFGTMVGAGFPCFKLGQQ
jgi:hypothetical protein